MNKIIYDDECDICCSLKNIFYDTDLFNLFVWIKSSEYKRDQSGKYDFDDNLLKTTIVIIKDNNQILVEFFACRYLMLRNVIFLPIAIFMYIPFISTFFGNKLYRYISRNRNCISIN